jgi:hypothetical protein
MGRRKLPGYRHLFQRRAFTKAIQWSLLLGSVGIGFALQSHRALVGGVKGDRIFQASDSTGFALDLSILGKYVKVKHEFLRI